MKKILIAFIGVLLCGCNPAYLFPIKPVDYYTEELYFLPRLSASTKNLLNYKSDIELEEYLYGLNSIKGFNYTVDMIKNNGANCIDSECVFYFLSERIDEMFIYKRTINLNKNNSSFSVFDEKQYIKNKKIQSIEFQELQKISIQIVTNFSLPVKTTQDSFYNFLKENKYVSQ